MTSFSHSATYHAYDHVLITKSDGSVGLHSRTYKGGREYISPHKDPIKTAQWELQQNKFRGSAEIKAPVVSGRTGAQSTGTVTATIIDEKGKRQVFGEIHEKARQGGKMLGKGAVGIARGLGRANPYINAFLIAEAALTGSKFFWSDEKGDFVQESDDDARIVFTTSKGSSISIDKTNEEDLKTQCNDCNVIGIVKGSVAANEIATSYCKSQTYKTSDNKTRNFNAVGWSGYCYDTVGNRISNDKAVKIAKYIGYVPMTLDEFDREATPEAQADPDVFVRAATDTQSQSKPKVTVLDGDAHSNPYTDPNTGETKQTGWRFRGGQVDEYDVPRPDLTPDSPQAPRTQPPTDTGSGTGTGTGDDTGTGDGDKDDTGDDDDPKKPKQTGSGTGSSNKNPDDTQDLCEKHPDILACDKQPKKVDDNDFPEIPTKTIDLKFRPDSVFDESGTCPQPISFDFNFMHISKRFEITFKYVCDVALDIRPILIALAWVTAAFFCIRAVIKEI